MSLYVQASRKRTDAPEGVHHAVCIDVVNLGMKVNEFDKKKAELVHKIEICWELAEENPETGRPYYAAKEYTLSLGDRATLRKHLERWLGRAFQPGENFDLETLVGMNCKLTITSKFAHWSGESYTNITAIEPPGDEEPLHVREDYVRQPPPAKEGESAPVIDDSDIPF
jgi:hypothetical protein